MPNIKSSEKRVLVSRALNAKHRAERSVLRTSLKKFDAAVVGGDREAAADAYKAAVKTVDRSIAKGIIHKNNGARKKSGMAKKISAMAE